MLRAETSAILGCCEPAADLSVRCHNIAAVGCILSIWVAFFSRQQRYCCWQAGDEGEAEHGLERLCRKARQLGMGKQERVAALAAVVRRRFLG